jgi:hypothetical protein
MLTSAECIGLGVAATLLCAYVANKMGWIQVSGGKSMTDLETVSFGYQDFWPQADKAYRQVFLSCERLTALANELSAAADVKATEPVEKAVHFLVRLTVFGMNEAILLCGNGCGAGGMKIVRGMFESSTLAEYLRLNPKQVEDYIDFGRILAWRRYQWTLTNKPKVAKRFPAETVKDIEDEYNRVKASFTNSKGRLRNQWTLKTIGEISDEIGRTDQYELVYSLACSIHHANAEGLLSYMKMKDESIAMDGPPSFEWTGEALIAAHTYFLLALDTLNDCCKLGFDDRIKAAAKEFKDVWTKRPETATS